MTGNLPTKLPSCYHDPKPYHCSPCSQPKSSLLIGGQLTSNDIIHLSQRHASDYLLFLVAPKCVPLRQISTD